ncbi:hypothetical protein [Nostoc sp. CCY0012]
MLSDSRHKPSYFYKWQAIAQFKILAKVLQKLLPNTEGTHQISSY